MKLKYLKEIQREFCFRSNKDWIFPITLKNNLQKLSKIYEAISFHTPDNRQSRTVILKTEQTNKISSINALAY